MDPEIDFGELFKQYDTVVMGRRSFEVMLKEGGDGSMPGLDVLVFSQTLRQEDFPAVSIVNTNSAETIRLKVALLKRSVVQPCLRFAGGGH